MEFLIDMFISVFIILQCFAKTICLMSAINYTFLSFDGMSIHVYMNIHESSLFVRHL